LVAAPQQQSQPFGSESMGRDGSPRVCLVSMPFIPAVSPGLGVSTLKSTLTAAGVSTDVYYGSLDYFRFFAPDRTPADALLDYAFLASTADLGDIFFSGALWGDSAPVDEAISSILSAPSFVFSRATRKQLLARLLADAARVNEFLEFCADRADFGRYEVVGFSSVFCQSVASLALARLIKTRHEHLHVVFGGPNCDGPMGVALLRSFPWVDCVLRGEADHTFPEYVTRRAAGIDTSSVPGLVYRDRSGDVTEADAPRPLHDLDSLPFPDFDDYFAQLPPALTSAETRGQVQVPIETSRGCWWGAVSHCTFCGLNADSMAFRAKSPARAIAEFRWIRERLGERNVCAVDNIISMTYFKEVLPALEELGLRIFYETKSNLKEEQVRQLARAGVRVFQPGIEGLSSEILELMKKGVKASQNIALLKWSQTYGIHPIWFYLYRFPFEREECYDEGIALMCRLVHLPPPRNPNPVVIDRYSPLFQRPSAFGLSNLRPATGVAVYYRGLSERERMDLAYHFEADLPQGDRLAYTQALWHAVLDWRRRHAAGATFRQLEGDHVTLLIDTRRDQPRAYLLTGLGHEIHGLLWQGATAAKLRRMLPALGAQQESKTLSAHDVALLLKAADVHAEEISGPAGEWDLDRFLLELDERWITAVVDGRHMGLATDDGTRRSADAPADVSASEAEALV
jgi:ribosomal peptide maturation radical SAM protein 1